MDKEDVKDKWASNYDQLRIESDRLWHASVFAWGFVSVLFTGYGFVINKFIESCGNRPSYNLLAVFISLLGLCVTAIWIALAKGTRTIQKLLEDSIKKIESDWRCFDIPREYIMGGTTNRIPDLDSSLRTQRNGAFSLSRINIFLPQCIWIVWLFIFVFHAIVYSFLFNAINITSNLILLVFCIGLYGIFIHALKRYTVKTYMRNEDHGQEFVYELLLRMERTQNDIPSIIDGKDSLRDFFMNKYNALNYDLFLALGEYMNADDYDNQWLNLPYHRLFASFRDEYMRGNFDGPDSRSRIAFYIQEINNEFDRWITVLERRYRDL